MRFIDINQRFFAEVETPQSGRMAGTIDGDLDATRELPIRVGA